MSILILALRLLFAPAIDPLGDSDGVIRQRQQDNLSRWGPAALPVAWAALSDDDAEIRRRAGFVVEDVLSPWKQAYREQWAKWVLCSGDGPLMEPEVWNAIRDGALDHPGLYLELAAECRRRGLVRRLEVSPDQWCWADRDCAGQAWAEFIWVMRYRARGSEPPFMAREED